MHMLLGAYIGAVPSVLLYQEQYRRVNLKLGSIN